MASGAAAFHARPRAEPAAVQPEAEPAEAGTADGEDIDDGTDSMASLRMGPQIQYSMVGRFQPVILSPLNALHEGWYPRLSEALVGFQDEVIRMNILEGYLSHVKGDRYVGNFEG